MSLAIRNWTVMAKGSIRCLISNWLLIFWSYWTELLALTTIESEICHGAVLRKINPFDLNNSERVKYLLLNTKNKLFQFVFSVRLLLLLLFKYSTNLDLQLVVRCFEQSSLPLMWSFCVSVCSLCWSSLPAPTSADNGDAPLRHLGNTRPRPIHRKYV